MKWLTLFLSGLLFALGLGIAGMTQPQKVIDFLDITGNWDPSLMFVMGGAVGVNMVLYRLTRRRPCPLYSNRFTTPRQRSINWRLVLGAAIFGCGWGISGYCPGPALVSTTAATGAIAVFVLAMLAGMQLHRLTLAEHEDDDVTGPGTEVRNEG
jgi:uncharacterized membrane protein YedE/YeeE